MAWKKHGREEIKGFWSRTGEMTGVLLKKIDGENPFYIVRLTVDKVAVMDRENPAVANKGDIIGVSSSSAVEGAFDELLGGGVGNGKHEVHLVSNGKKPNKKGTGEYWDIEVESRIAGGFGGGDVPF